jgi:predicted metal-binding membrane protein
MDGAATVEAIARRERAVVAAALAVIVGLAWLHLRRLGGAMSDMDQHMGMPDMHAWSPGDLLLVGVMWAVMMVAMMLPSAAPMILTFTTMNRRRDAPGRPLAKTGIFVLAYVVVWAAFSVIATGVQWALHTAALLSPGMVTASPLVGAAVLIAAGGFQWTPLKRACLIRCRSPLSFLMTEWREGTRGSFVMGLRHGANCVGCCWLLMALLFIAGVMNLVWVAAIAAFVLVEKVLPAGDRLGRIGGALLIVAGVAMIALSPTQ